MSPVPTAPVFPTVPGLPVTGGVAMNAPPASILEAATKAVHDAMAQVPPGEHGAIVGIVTEDESGRRNANLAFVSKVGSHVDVTAWVGKSWGPTVVGAGIVTGGAGKIHW